jgi:mono/diheme cytochrome c family protein
MKTIRIAALVLSCFACYLLAADAAPSDAGGKKSKTAASNKVSTSEKAMPRGERLFSTHCASCHSGGGNNVNPAKPIKKSQVLVTLATFKEYLNEPLGTMPHYEHLIKDDKLLQDLYFYVRKFDDEAPAKKVDKPVGKNKSVKP